MATGKRDLDPFEEVGETGQRGAQGAERPTSTNTADFDSLASYLNRIRLNASPTSGPAAQNAAQPRYLPDRRPIAFDRIFSDLDSSHPYVVRSPQDTYRRRGSRAEHLSSSEEGLDVAPRSVDSVHGKIVNDSGVYIGRDELGQSSDVLDERTNSVVECSPLQEASGVKKSSISRTSRRQQSGMSKNVENFLQQVDDNASDSAQFKLGTFTVAWHTTAQHFACYWCKQDPEKYQKCWEKTGWKREHSVRIEHARTHLDADSDLIFLLRYLERRKGQELQNLDGRAKEIALWRAAFVTVFPIYEDIKELLNPFAGSLLLSEDDATRFRQESHEPRYGSPGQGLGSITTPIAPDQQAGTRHVLPPSLPGSFYPPSDSYGYVWDSGAERQTESLSLANPYSGTNGLGINSNMGNRLNRYLPSVSGNALLEQSADDLLPAPFAAVQDGSYIVTGPTPPLASFFSGVDRQDPLQFQTDCIVRNFRSGNTATGPANDTTLVRSRTNPSRLPRDNANLLDRVPHPSRRAHSESHCYQHNPRSDQAEFQPHGNDIQHAEPDAVYLNSPVTDLSLPSGGLPHTPNDGLPSPLLRQQQDTPPLYDDDHPLDNPVDEHDFEFSAFLKEDWDPTGEDDQV